MFRENMQRRKNILKALDGSSWGRKRKNSLLSIEVNNLVTSQLLLSYLAAIPCVTDGWPGVSHGWVVPGFKSVIKMSIVIGFHTDKLAG